MAISHIVFSDDVTMELFPQNISHKVMLLQAVHITQRNYIINTDILQYGYNVMVV